MAGAGAMREQVRFERRALAGGVRKGAFAAYLTARAAYSWLRGGEGVVAQRLQGNQPLVMTIWASQAARALDSSFRAVDTRTGRIFSIEGVTPGKDDPVKQLDVLCRDAGTHG